MGDRFANVVIVLMIVIIFGLGALYYMKVTGNYEYSFYDNYSEPTQNQNNTGIINSNSSSSTNTYTDIKTDIKTENSLNIKTGIGISLSNSFENVFTKQEKGYKYNNRYYYNCLDNYSKAIYDAIVDNIDSIKDGACAIDVNYNFKPVLEKSDGKEKISGYYEDAINAINLDIPNLFYLDFSKMYLNIEKNSSLFSSSYKLYIDPGEYPNYYVQEFSSKEQVENASNQIEEVKEFLLTNYGGTSYEEMQKLHDWFLDNLQYDLQVVQRATVYGGLVNKIGVCEAYARSYKLILDELGIENILVTGIGASSNGSQEEHMWNYVKINEKWYAVDVTWDDPIILGGGRATEELKHKYFLVGSNVFFRNHIEERAILSSGNVFMPPELSLENYV